MANPNLLDRLMSHSGITGALWRCLSLLAVCTLIGGFYGQPLPALLLALAACLAWLFWRIRQLEHWVQQCRRSDFGSQKELSGVWAEISNHVLRMMARHEKERLRLQAVIHRVQEMTAALTDAVVLVDRRGNIEWWNPAATRLFGFRDIDQGQPLTNLIRDPRFVGYFDSQDYDTPLTLMLPRKELHLEYQIHGFGEGERLLIARDITRLFKLEQMRKDFVANASHELRTPLTVIQGYLESIEDSPQLPSGWQRMIGQMQQQVQRMTHLISDLIVLSRLETDQRAVSDTPVPLAALIQGVVADAQALSGDKHHRFSIDADTNLNLIGNEHELRSALSNLVVNAVNYSPPGSRIDIGARADADAIVLQVCDQGIGIDPRHIPRLTERFYRVDPSRSVASGGTGLGLAIVKHILLRHDAELSISSQVGKGSAFTCRFPGTQPRRQP